MKVGDLVKYDPSPMKNTYYEPLVGIVLKVSSNITVKWNNGKIDDDMTHPELEVISESR